MDVIKPKIRRVWNARLGVMEWGVNPTPSGRWGTGISQQAHYDWRQAKIWCNVMNSPQLRAQAAMMEPNEILREPPWKPVPR